MMWSVVVLCGLRSPLWPQAVRRAMFKDIPACDFRPSLLATVLAHLGTVTEIVAPLAAVCPGGGPVPEALRLLGTLGCAGVNLFIFSNYPLGSVQEVCLCLRILCLLITDASVY